MRLIRLPRAPCSRYMLFSKYVDVLEEAQHVVQPEDTQFFRSLSENEDEHILFRAEATACLGYREMALGNYQETAEQYRKTMRLIALAQTQDRAFQFNPTATVGGYPGFHFRRDRVYPRRHQGR
jgi:hypothetical protein